MIFRVNTCQFLAPTRENDFLLISREDFDINSLARTIACEKNERHVH